MRLKYLVVFALLVDGCSFLGDQGAPLKTGSTDGAVRLRLAATGWREDDLWFKLEVANCSSEEIKLSKVGLTPYWLSSVRDSRGQQMPKHPCPPPGPFDGNDVVTLGPGKVMEIEFDLGVAVAEEFLPRGKYRISCEYYTLSDAPREVWPVWRGSASSNEIEFVFGGRR